MENQNLYQIALTMINGVGDILARHLLEFFGDAETIFREKRQRLEKVPGIGSILAKEIAQSDVLKRAEQELEFMEKNRIACHYIADEDYPARLRECPDAPIIFYTKGNTELNATKVIGIVGTRKATDYGRSLTAQLLRDLSIRFPELLIVSGLAYGTDIYAHRCALREGLPTVGVLAHGLDRIYPSAHTSTAMEMMADGGLLTDFPSRTNPDRPNFLKRNRLIAGLADATIVVESGERGGSLVTADIAFSYGRDVYTFPGRTTDPYSKGCNDLIRRNKAGLITSATDFVSAMRWDCEQKPSAIPVQTTIAFPENSLQQQLINLMCEQETVHINSLALATGQPVFKLSQILFDMEMSGIVQALPGNIYKLP